MNFRRCKAKILASEGNILNSSEEYAKEIKNLGALALTFEFFCVVSRQKNEFLELRNGFPVGFVDLRSWLVRD